MKFLFAQTTPGVTWRYFWPMLALAFVARIAFALATEKAIHPDHVMQYLEQGYRLSHGYGVIPWEYVYGIRSWLIPGFVAGILELAQLLGLDHPRYYTPMVEVAFSAISLAIPVGCYRLAQLVSTERVAILSFLFGCFWTFFLYYGQTPMPSMLTACPLIWVCVLMLRAPTARNLILIGVLAAFAVAIRFQVIPAVGMLILFCAYALGKRFGYVLIGGLVTSALIGLIDLFTWGGFLASYIDNFYFNFVDGISERYSIDPWYYYLLESFEDTGAVFLAMLIGIILILPRAWPIWASILIGFVFLHIPAHKEYRFIVWVMPFGAIGLAYLIFRLHDWLAFSNRMRWGAHGLMAVWLAIVVMLDGANKLGLQEYRPTSWEMQRMIRLVTNDPDATGLGMQTPRGQWWAGGGYYQLGIPIPIYFPKLHGMRDPMTSPVDFATVSHILAQDAHIPDGYSLIAETRSLKLWKSDTPTQPLGDRNYDFLAPSGNPPEAYSKPPRGVRYPPVPTGFPQE